MAQSYIRDGIYSTDEVFTLLSSSDENDIIVNGHRVNRVSARYKCFKFDGLSCCRCGIEGKYFALERIPNNTPEDRYHFNLYAVDENGEEVLMHKHKKYITTKDFKLKKSYETICEKCLGKIRRN